MPIYDYYCNKCGQVRKDIKIKLADKDKTHITCDKCETEMTQSVAPLRFTLEGSGWYENNDHPYAITQTELNRNLDIEKRVEDGAYEAQYQDSKNL